MLMSNNDVLMSEELLVGQLLDVSGGSGVEISVASSVASSVPSVAFSVASLLGQRPGLEQAQHRGLRRFYGLLILVGQLGGHHRYGFVVRRRLGNRWHFGLWDAEVCEDFAIGKS